MIKKYDINKTTNTFNNIEELIYLAREYDKTSSSTPKFVIKDPSSLMIITDKDKVVSTGR